MAAHQEREAVLSDACSEKTIPDGAVLIKVAPAGSMGEEAGLCLDSQEAAVVCQSSPVTDDRGPSHKSLGGGVRRRDQAPSLLPVSECIVETSAGGVGSVCRHVFLMCMRTPAGQRRAPFWGNKKKRSRPPTPPRNTFAAPAAVGSESPTPAIPH